MLNWHGKTTEVYMIYCIGRMQFIIPPKNICNIHLDEVIVDKITSISGIILKFAYPSVIIDHNKQGHTS